MTYDTDLQDRLAHARNAEPTESELAQLHREIAQTQPTRRARPRRRMVVLLVGLGMAIPATALAWGAAGDVLDSFLGLSKSTPVSADLTAGTVIDEQAGLQFSVIRRQPDDVCLSLNRSVEICGDPNDSAWSDQLGEHAVAPVGTLPPKPRTGPVPLFVLTAPGVTEVQVTYERGAATTRKIGNHGAVVLVDADRGPSEVIARDNSGAVLGRADVSERQWKWCYREAGCPELDSD
jgi:hypothetical protein